MELSRQEYPALLRTLSPNSAIAVLDERVRLIGQINADIGDWLAERRRVEEAYVQGLRKLASRHPKDPNDQLGVFKGPWQSVVDSIESLAQSHGIFAAKIESDVERPLKEYRTKNREMQGMTTIQGNLVTIARDVENAQKKASKVSAGKSSASKVANATSDVEAANQQWESQAPYVFEQLQALDESRVNHLRDVLTQLQTHEVDQVERSRATAESVLNELLSVDTSDEISTFVARNAAAEQIDDSRGESRRGLGSTGAAELPSIRSTPSRPSAAPTEEPPVDRPVPLPSSAPKIPEVPPRPKGKVGGLRRLGTVLSRPGKGSKSMDMPPTPEKRSRPSRNPLRRGPSSRQDMQAIPSPPQTSASNKPSSPPQLDTPNFGASSFDRSERPSTPPSGLRREAQVNGDTTQQTPKRSSTIPMTNGVQSTRDMASQEAPAVTPRRAETQRDADGFNVPNSDIDEITKAQQEAAATGETEQPAFKLNIQNQPIQEDPDAQTAFSSVANTLRAQAVTPRKPGTVRGRRDVRNTIFVPSGQSVDSIGGSPAPVMPSLLGTNNAASPLAEVNRGADTQSIRSAHSMSSVAQPTVAHPQMHQLGLNSSVVETVNATFSQSQVTKAVVIGEMALQYNKGDDLSSTGSEHVRIDNFAVLEKVAPNPTFISQKPDSSGEYSVALAEISRPTVAFKYQVHLDESMLTIHAPLSLTPSWKIEPSQTSVIVTYALNPGFEKQTVSLKNAVVFVTIEGARAQSCQSKPPAIFSKEKSLIYWKLGDLTLEKGSSRTSQKLLARFATDGEAKAGAVEARWEIVGEHAVGIGSGLGLSLATAAAAKEEGVSGTSSDPFADESPEKSATGATGGGAAAGGTIGWREVPVTRRIVSGRYNAN